jgi:hypothetical protein
MACKASLFSRYDDEATLIDCSMYSTAYRSYRGDNATKTAVNHEKYATLQKLQKLQKR